MLEIAATRLQNNYAAYVTNGRYFVFAVPVVIGLLGVLLQSLTYLNHDVAWVLFSAQWLIDGKQFGRDLIAPNPPLIWWISAIPAVVAKATGLAPVLVFRLFMAAAIAVSLAAADRLLAASGTSTVRRGMFLALGAYLLTIGAGSDFGQREWLAAILILPYLMAIALRLGGGTVSVPSGLIIGAVAGLGIAFKPYFLLIPLLVEPMLWIRQKSVRSIYRPEAIGALISVSAYLVAVWVYARPWLTEVVPDIARIYWAFSHPLSELVVLMGAMTLLVIAGALVVMRTSPSAPAKILALAALGFLAAAIWQAKGYSYQVYPAVTCIALALALGIEGMGSRARTFTTTVLIIILGHSLYDSAAAIYARSAAGRLGTNMGAVVDFVRTTVPKGGSFLAVSTHPYPGFPTALYADRQWASPIADRLFLPAVVRLRAAGPSADAATLKFAERKSREAILRDLARHPALVLFDVHSERHGIGRIPFDFLAYYREDPLFREAWKAYERMDVMPGGYVAWRRKPGRTP